ncbi:MAG: porin [Burkholderiaceae bacterium]
MKHKKTAHSTLIALAVLASAGTAYAQSSVTIYGVIDTGVRYTNGLSSANAAINGTVTAVNSGTNTTSRLGYRGTEDLGGGMKAVFNLESGLSTDSGSTPSTKFFDRASFVGLEAGWGAVSFGRQTTVLADAVGPVDPLGSRFAGFNPNIGTAALSAHGLGIEYGPSNATTGAYRLDNSVKYVGRFNDFTVRAMHALGEKDGNTSQLSASGLGLAYQSENYTATLGYGQFKSDTDLKLKAYVGGVSAKLGNSKLSLTYGSHEAETTSTAKTRNTTLGLGGTVPLSSSLDMVLSHYIVKRTRTAKLDDGFNRSVAFLEYKLSKRTRLYGEFDYTKWKTGYLAAGLPSNSKGVSFGIVHSF